MRKFYLWLKIVLGLIILFSISSWIAGCFVNKKDKASAPVLPKPTPQLNETVATVVIDPGHGGFDAGASGRLTKVSEAELNIIVSEFVKEELEKRNFTVIMTHDKNVALADSKKEDMKIRREKMHSSGADLTVSIHMNMFSDTSVSGPMVFYTKEDEPSKRLAEAILNSICNDFALPKRLVNIGDYYVIRDSKIPAVIVECGFLSNPNDERNLCDADYQYKMAQAIAKGIDSYVKENSD